MCNDVGEGSRCCAFYSAIGALFTLWVGMMIHTQPFYIGGLKSDAQAQTSAFGAMGMFVFTFLASLCGIYYDSHFKKEPLPAENGDAAEGYQLSKGDVTSYGTSS
mmetsp:Transcript_3109/g.5270  ORF Transcript_3109/g.5270 Transcript_3109/m.5270 type:complete len:105 (-) Transcript_3109:57-371(-)|eukprot:CAMPEP_0116550400 /NCGR_PEP_ID=MMETSP0397-20121206/5407_1 /TAXON_ID=216820 /ORGANISM="Cyclophora tenuis, Strain ECT3854" /LENGTH=104 /DNA_ID=CAMNT_0004075229 /DNA_START=109 /DNA_END=423 /DNA_ORIENTATION=+